MKGRKVTVPGIIRKKGKERIVALTAYDFLSAGIVERAGTDVVLVGDSLAMVVLGHPNTLQVTMEAMVHHLKAVRRGLTLPLLVADMPYGSYHVDKASAARNALRLVQEGGAEAVKVEGARREAIEAIRECEIPVMGHLGLTPQSVNRLGGYGRQGNTPEEEERILREAKLLESLGVFSIVLENVPAALAGRVTRELSVPTIGIGAGPRCDGQILVFHDLLGLTPEPPPFVKAYGEFGAQMEEALRRYGEDVRMGVFPREEE